MLMPAIREAFGIGRIGLQVIAVGGPFDGLTLYGRFSSDGEDAVNFAEHDAKHEDWWIVDLNDPL